MHTHKVSCTYILMVTSFPASHTSISCNLSMHNMHSIVMDHTGHWLMPCHCRCRAARSDVPLPSQHPDRHVQSKQTTQWGIQRWEPSFLRRGLCAVGGILFRSVARPSGGDSDLRNWVSITKPLVYHSFHFYPPKEAPSPFGNTTIGFSSSLRF